MSRYGVKICTMPDADSWRILRCDSCGREIPERVALCWSCFATTPTPCHGRLQPTGKFIPKKDRWE
jgi:hypothetical protein